MPELQVLEFGTKPRIEVSPHSLTIRDIHILLSFSYIIKRTGRDTTSNLNGPETHYSNSLVTFSPLSFYQPSDKPEMIKSGNNYLTLPAGSYSAPYTIDYMPMRATKGSTSTIATLGTNPAHFWDASNIFRLKIHLKHATISKLRNYL